MDERRYNSPKMNIEENVNLTEYSTMALGGKASYLVHIKSKDELVQAVNFAKQKNLQVLMIGSGSNIVWSSQGFEGLVIVDNIKGVDFDFNDDGSCVVKVAAGEIWDSVVEQTVQQGLSGIEALSLVPGTAGATPVQNVGAYGQEIADTLVSVEAYDSQIDQFIIIDNKDCSFGYRTSRFKTLDHGRYYITSLMLKLKKTNPSPPFYRTLEAYLNEHNITEYTPEVIRGAVIDIRNSKLPDPKLVHNCGSFFANPIISIDQFSSLSQNYPDMPGWPSVGEKVKVSAAWLIEKAGFKDYHDEETGMATWSKQSLVLVNEHASSTEDLLSFKAKIVGSVKEKFNIELVQEPEFLPKP